MTSKNKKRLKIVVGVILLIGMIAFTLLPLFSSGVSGY